jgi:hypothetical protein
MITVFFYFQHRVYVERYDVEKYVEFEEFGLMVHNVEKYNYENRGFNRPDFLYELNLPGKLTSRLLNVWYFYSFPYEIDSVNPKFDINCEIIIHGDNAFSIDARDLLENKLDIQYNNNTSDSIIKHANTSAGSSSNRNTIKLTFTTDWNESLLEGLSIVDLVNEQEYIVNFSLPFTKVNFDYFNRRPDYMRNDSSTIISRLLDSYAREERNISESYIGTEYIETFPWDILDRYSHFEPEEFTASYVCKYLNENNVFMMKVGGHLEGDSIDELIFYLIYDNSMWKVIDLSVD